jgi:FtsH-binding integral membrane protein
MDFGFQSQQHGRRTGGGGFDALKRLGHISPAVQSHLKQVYLTLCSALAFSALGAYLHILLNVGGTLTTVGCLAAIAFLVSLPPSQDQQRNRFALLMSAALLQGASLGPLLDLALHFDPRILVTAFVGTAIAFGCFSGAAIVAKRREYLYLGGLLSSALSILLWLQFAASIFGHSSATFKFEVPVLSFDATRIQMMQRQVNNFVDGWMDGALQLYFGLLVFLGYMVFDTQEIIERAHQGDMDYIKHALTLFTDFVAVLVRVLVIMVSLPLVVVILHTHRYDDAWPMLVL